MQNLLEKVSKATEKRLIQKFPCLNFGDEITLSELSTALKNMKCNKTPGIDGISLQFLKVFWSKMKFFIKNAINTCYKKGTLLTSLWQVIITFFPKDNKDRKYIKNWHPISLLSVIYQMASIAIANRLKPYLTDVILKTQTGFITGRHIGENTRILYDLLCYTEKEQIPGLLMLIDFEKAFDTVSWQFIYQVLHIFGLKESFITWIKPFNNDKTTYVLQCGILSKSIPIGRGCRKGDSISSYLFILGAEILSLLILYSKDVRVIPIGTQTLELTQFALL